jgi:hypothetical protein
MKKLLMVLSIVMIALAMGCKKSDSNCTLDATSILGAYKITALTYQATATSTVDDEFAFMPACQKDNILTFLSNGIYTYSEGVTSCSPSTADSGIWSLSGSTLTLDGGANTTTFNCTTLVIKSTGTTDIGTITLVKQ